MIQYSTNCHLDFNAYASDILKRYVDIWSYWMGMDRRWNVRRQSRIFIELSSLTEINKVWVSSFGVPNVVSKKKYIITFTEQQTYISRSKAMLVRLNWKIEIFIRFNIVWILAFLRFYFCSASAVVDSCATNKQTFFALVFTIHTYTHEHRVIKEKRV